VDSGQLLVCDPCYIDSEWVRDQEPGLEHPVYRDRRTGRRWQFTYPGEDGVKARPRQRGVRPFPGTYADPIPEYGDRAPNDLIEAGTWVPLPQKASSRRREFSYHGCCQTTTKATCAGPLRFSRGHAGAGVVFASGYGDGYYPVYGRLNEEGRIVEVRVVME